MARKKSTKRKSMNFKANVSHKTKGRKHRHRKGSKRHTHR